MAALQLVDESHSTVINKALSNEESESVLLSILALCKLSVSLPSGSCKLTVLPLDASCLYGHSRKCEWPVAAPVRVTLAPMWARCAPMVAYLGEANLLVL